METTTRSSNSLATSAMICGIIACALNTLMFTAIFGIILGIVAIALGITAYKRHPFGKTGFILGLLSLVIVAAYLFTFIAIKIVDPFV